MFSHVISALVGGHGRRPGTNFQGWTLCPATSWANAAWVAYTVVSPDFKAKIHQI